MDYEEDPLDAVIRELGEETGIVGWNPVLFSVLGSPGRDHASIASVYSTPLMWTWKRILLQETMRFTQNGLELKT